VRRPFRWDLRHREQLGRLLDGPVAEAPADLVEGIRAACARVVALSSDGDLVFVGRSPENLFDYLSGALEGTSWARRLALLNVSIRTSAGDLDAPARHALAEHLEELGLAPREIARRARPTVLVDLVAAGTTFGAIATLLLETAEANGVDSNAVRRRLRFVGITPRSKTSPKTERWHQHADWTSAFRPSAIKNVSIDAEVWRYLGNSQEKVTATNPPDRWTRDDLEKPPRSERPLRALRLAVELFDCGRRRDERARFAARLARDLGIKQAWVRRLVAELREKAGRR
jgi:hypothetical protein